LPRTEEDILINHSATVTGCSHFNLCLLTLTSKGIHWRCLPHTATRCLPCGDRTPAPHSWLPVSFTKATPSLL